MILHRYTSTTFHSFAAVLPTSMSSSAVEWSCSTCDITLDNKQRTHPPCHTQTTWTCLLTQRSGKYDNFKDHAKCCEYCSPDQRQPIHSEKRADNENRMQAVEEDEKGRQSRWRAPYSPLSFSSNTCAQLSLLAAL